MKNHSEGEINEKLSKEISNILFKYIYFYDVLLISFDNLLGIDSKYAFQYFQGFSQIKAQQSFILFLTKKDIFLKFLIYFNLLLMNSLIKEMYMHSNFLRMKKK